MRANGRSSGAAIGLPRTLAAVGCGGSARPKMLGETEAAFAASAPPWIGLPHSSQKLASASAAAPHSRHCMRHHLAGQDRQRRLTDYASEAAISISFG